MSLQVARPPSPPTLPINQPWGHQPPPAPAQTLSKAALKACLNAIKHILRRAIHALSTPLHTLAPSSSSASAATPPPPPPTFPLMRLPPELRLHVYSQILHNVHVLERSQFHPIVAPDLSFLRSNRLVHREGRMLCYDVHDFALESPAELARLRLRLTPAQQRRVKSVTLFFCFSGANSDDNDDAPHLARWRALCPAVAAALVDVRRLRVRWRVFWHCAAFPTMSALRPAWEEGMAALRSMRSLRKVDGCVWTQMVERPEVEAGGFVLEFEGLEGLEEAFAVEQVERVRRVYEE